jgi:hypothetical protein
MNKEFIPYEQALELKELGFDYQCVNYYSHYGNGQVHLNNLVLCSKIGVETNNDKGILAPLYQQAFRWFREKYNLDSFVKHLYISTIKVGYYFGIDQYKGIEFQMGLVDCYKTYEEAELACLKKLIQIVKNINEIIKGKFI